MKIGLRLTGEMRRRPIQETAAWAAEHGFTDLEADLADDLVAQLHGHGLTAWCAGMGVRLLSADDAAREAAIDKAKAAVDSAAHQGLKVLACAHGMVEGRSGADQINLFKAGFTPVAAHAERRGVRLGFENFHARGRNLMLAPERWDAAFDAVPSPSLGLIFDPSHLVAVHVDWLWAMRAYRDRIVYAHAKDTEIFPDKLNRYSTYGPLLDAGGPGSGVWWRYRLPGFGVVDWRKFADVLAEASYEGPLNIEHEDQVWGFTQDIPRMREGLLVAKRYLEQVMV